MDIINVGIVPNDGTGDTLRDAFIAVNDNFQELVDKDILLDADIVLINDAITLLESSKADVVHTHTISQIIGLQTALNNKLDVSTYVSDMTTINNSFITVNGLINDILDELLLKVGEAPIDGLTYGRKDGAWVEVTGGGTSVTNTSELTNDGADGLNPFITALDLEPLEANISNLDSRVDDLENNSNINFGQFVEGQLAYFVPIANSATFGATLRTNVLTLSGNSAVNERIFNVLFTTSSVAGTMAFQRGSTFQPNLASTSEIRIKWKFKFESNVTDTRFFTGLSSLYTLSAPTNVAPDSLTNSIGICKMAVSQNLQIVHNDGVGLATLIDLGTDFPANNTVDYWYTLEISKLKGLTDVNVIVKRFDASGGVLVSENVITSDYSVGTLAPTSWITNNATASAASFKHFGCVLTQNQF